MKKRNWYYKARQNGVKANVSAIKLNCLFQRLLSQFEYQKKYHNPLKQQILNKLRNRTKNSLSDSIRLKKRIAELKNELEKIEELFIKGKLHENLYEK